MSIEAIKDWRNAVQFIDELLTMVETGLSAYSDLLVNSMNEIGAQRAQLQKAREWMDDESYGGWLNTDYEQAFNALQAILKDKP